MAAPDQSRISKCAYHDRFLLFNPGQFGDQLRSTLIR
jgi:hypothetical protein